MKTKTVSPQDGDAISRMMQEQYRQRFKKPETIQTATLDLLASLQWIVERLQRGGKAASSDAISQAIAAIAKAEQAGNARFTTSHSMFAALQRIRDGMADDRAYRDAARAAIAEVEGCP